MAGTGGQKKLFGEVCPSVFFIMSVFLWLALAWEHGLFFGHGLRSGRGMQSKRFRKNRRLIPRPNGHECFTDHSRLSYLIIASRMGEQPNVPRHQ